MADINEILLRITGDDDDASNSLEKIAGLLEALDRVEADPSVDLDTGKAEKDLASFVALLKAASGEVNFTADLDTGQALGQFAALTSALSQAGPFNLDVNLQEADAIANLAALTAGIESVPDIHVNADADTAAATTKLAVLAGLVRQLDGQDVNIDFDIDEGGSQRAQTSTKKLLGVFGALTDSLGFLGSTFQHTAVNIGPFSTSLNPVTLVAITLVLAAIVSLIGALGAVAASAAAAAIAVAGLASAFIAAMGPAVLVVVAAAIRLAKVFQALKAQDDARAQQATRSAEADAQATSRMEQRQDAARSLARANEDLGRATVQAYREIADAAEKVTDAERAMERSRLDREQANLSLEQARLNLKKFRAELGLTGTDLDNTFEKFTDVNFDPRKLNAELRKVDAGGQVIGDEQELRLKQLILDVKQARLGQKEATDRVGDSQRELNRATEEHNRYLREGIRANQGYVSALRARDDAQRALNRARREPVDPIAVSKAEEATKKLSKSERLLLAVIKDVRKVWQNLFSGATNAVIASIARSLRLVSRAARPLRPLITALGESMGGMIENLATAFTDPGFINQIKGFIQLWIDAAGPLTNIIIQIVRALMAFATAAAPYVVPALQAIADVFASLTGKAEDATTMDSFMKLVMDNLRDWVYLFTQVGRIIAAVFFDASDTGRSLVRWLGDAAKKLADFLNTKEGREELKKFLDDAFMMAQDLVVSIIIIGKTLIAVGHTIRDVGIGAKRVWDELKKTFNSVIKPIKTFWKWLTDLGFEWDKFWSIDNLVNPLEFLVEPLFNAALHIGRAIGNGLIQGVTDRAPDFLKFFGPSGDLAGKVIGGLGKTFKINSPSKVTMEIGEQIVAGLKVGIENGGVGLERFTVATLATPVVNGISVPRSPVGVGAGSGGDTYNVDRVEISSPGGGSPDPRIASMQFARELQRRGR